MITIPELAAEALGNSLSSHMGRRFGAPEAGLVGLSFRRLPGLHSSASATVTLSIIMSNIRCS